MVLNLATLVGYLVITSCIGGFCLSAVSDGNVSPSLGIVIMALLALVISFCGYNVLHYYERFAWIPALVAVVITVGCGGSNLSKQAAPEPATASGVMSFAMIIASYQIPYACMASDFTTYITPKAPS